MGVCEAAEKRLDVQEFRPQDALGTAPLQMAIGAHPGREAAPGSACPARQAGHGRGSAPLP